MSEGTARFRAGAFRSHQRGFTLIELMVVVAIGGLVLLLAAPSFQDMIQMQRLRAANAQLVTDMQYARSEAARRGQVVRVNLGSASTNTCYVLYVSAIEDDRCDCTRGVAAACTGGPPAPNRVELRTVVLPRSEGVVLSWPDEQDTAFGYDPVTGGLVAVPLDSVMVPLAQAVMRNSIDTARTLQTTIVQSGRPTVCAPDAARMQVKACPVAP